MKKMYFTALSIIGGLMISQAQVTITAASNQPVLGDQYSMSTSTNYSLIDLHIGNAGANATWDYSLLDMTGAKTVNYSYVDPLTTPNAAQITGANLVLKYKSTSSTQKDIFQYYTISASGISKVGYGKSMDTYEAFSNAINTINYPFAYGDVMNDSYASVFTNVYGQGNFVFSETGTTKTEADAYGKLMLPNGVVLNNVVRVKMVQYNKEINTAVPPGLQLLPTTYDTVTSYAWYAQGYKFPVLTYSYSTLAQKYSLEVSNNLSTGIATAINSINVELFPNPSTGIINLSVSENMSNLSINVVDVTGKSVYNQRVGAVISGGVKILDLSNLAKGIYVVQVNNNNILMSKRIVIE